ncbi:drug resistance transporter, EmrB/QacA subfamily [Jatrophihabitans endophyticus]|uniref:Drug resistance transporter, EmrB/QacA subfamily n=1 Tax=Jatrophihabitans endophyticus TaxID=1206085 RepID=A0A1M5HT48_9ACTN|nr:MFS transporter [Jatrophihabitans endophyticus]SHG19139.1 drug resistance transporter, EmrB/QacA subfamily [Jatrophihabitans endophyticus]
MSLTTDRSPVSLAYALRWPALFVILAAEIMDLLDALITSIAGPTIVGDLGGGETLIQWLSAGYTIAMASGLLIGGRLGDIYGRRRMFLVGMAGFTAMSLACALAQSPEMLVGTRVLQGLLGAVMLPQGLGLIKQMFPPDEVAKAFGAFGPVMGLSAVGGPILAGWLVDLDAFGWGWRTIFAINVPVGLIALVAGSRVLPASTPDRRIRIDVGSAAVAATAMVLLIYPLIQGRELGWPAWSYVMLAAGVATFVVFAALERRRDRRGEPTLVTPTLFAKKAFTGGLVTGMALFGALMGTSIVFTLFVQLGLGYSPLKAGLAGTAQAVGMIVGFVVAQPLNARFGRRIMLVGELLTAAALIAFVLTLHAAGDGVGIAAMSPSLAVLGIGMGLTMAPFFDIVLAGVDDTESGSASGALTSVQQLGGAFGVAVLGTVFFHALGHDSSVGAFRDAASAAVWLAAGFVALGFVLTFLLPRRAREDASGHGG